MKISRAYPDSTPGSVDFPALPGFQFLADLPVFASLQPDQQDGRGVPFPDGDMLNIGRTFVHPDQHRKGHGIRMMREIENTVSGC